MALRVGVVGLVHDHVWSLMEDWEAVPEAEIVAIAEPALTLHAKVQLVRSTPRFFSSWREMLETAELDAVMITTENNASLEIVQQAASRGIPIMLEKPLAATLEEGQKIYDAGLGGKGAFLVNWFTFWDDAIWTALSIAKRGDLGRLQYFRFRIGHAGPKEIGCAPEFYNWLYDPIRNGGGALVDFCGYGAAMAAWLFGAPKSVYGLAGRFVKTDIPAEDNGLLALRFEGAMALCEGSWTQLSQTEIDGPIIHGEKGSVSVVKGELHLVTSIAGHYEVLPPMSRPPEHQSGPAYFAHCIASGTRPGGLFDPFNSLIAQKCLAGGLESAASGNAVVL